MTETDLLMAYIAAMELKIKELELRNIKEQAND